METVRRLTREVRIQAKYDRSLEVLRYLKRKKESKELNQESWRLASRKKKFFKQ
jgi:lipoate synthase